MSFRFFNSFVQKVWCYLAPVVRKPATLVCAQVAPLRAAVRLPAVQPRIVAAAATEAGKKEARASANYVRGAPSKVRGGGLPQAALSLHPHTWIRVPCALQVRRVLDTIRGKSYEEALMILEYMPYKACEPILKVCRRSTGVQRWGCCTCRAVPRSFRSRSA